MNDLFVFNAETDLLIEREVPISKQLIWDAWTKPEHIIHWFTPKPWQTVEAEIDLRPGGRFYTKMRSPDGEDFPNVGCILEVVPQTRLVWTDCLAPGFRPLAGPSFGPEEKGFFTGIISLADVPGGTKYSAMAMHQNPEKRKEHEDMGFHQGWNAALDQLVAYMLAR